MVGHLLRWRPGRRRRARRRPHPCPGARCCPLHRGAAFSLPAFPFRCVAMPVSVPSSLALLLASAPVVGVSGSRRPSQISRWAVCLTLAFTPGVVITGCASGIDQVARQRVAPSRLRVFRAASRLPGALAARSTACVQAVAAAGGLWLSFPSSPCPAALVPSRSASACFSGSGSGSWASLALARGLGLASIVFLPAGITPPAPYGLHQVAATAPGAWWFGPGSGQIPLFASTILQ